jgi:hypothetical protein
VTADPPVEDVQPARTVFVPAIAWAVPGAAALAVLGAFLPWFQPRGTLAGQTRTFDALYSVKDKVGLVVPVVLVLASISVVGLLLGKPRGRLAAHPQPAHLVALYSVAAGVAGLIALVVAFAMVPSLYGFVVAGRTLSWTQYEHVGVHLTRGADLGFWLTGAAAVLALAAGVAMLVLIRRDRPSDRRSDPE